MRHLTGNGEVVAFGRTRSTLRQPAINQVHAYWQALRSGHGLPRRSEIDPRGIAYALPHVCILERVAPAVARIRLAGMHLGELMGMEVRGMPFSALFAPASRDVLGRHLERLFSAPATVFAELSGEPGLGRPALAGQMLLLPLCDSGGAVSRILGCLVVEGHIGRHPRRLMLGRADVQLLDMPGKRPAAQPAPLAGLAEEPLPFSAAPASASPALRLVVSNDR